jgi:hypothetical protein
MKRRLDNRLYYFTVEDESLLAETFPKFEDETYAIAYKVTGTDDVFVTTAETKAAMDRHDVPFNCLAEEDGIKIALHHSAMSREELNDYEDALKALALAYRAIGLVCVGINGAANIDLSEGAATFTYFTAPAGHTFLWRMVFEREEAVHYVEKYLADDHTAYEWASTLPLVSSEELVGYH